MSDLDIRRVSAECPARTWRPHPPPARPAPRSFFSTRRAATASGDGERLSIGELLAALEARAFGIGALVFALLAGVPMPPGVPLPALFGLAIGFIAIQMTLGLHRLWLPGFIAKRCISRNWLQRTLERERPRVERITRAAKPRLLFLTGGLGARLVGVLLLVHAILLLLPIPFLGNVPPAIAAVILALGLTERDGVLILAGVVASAVAVAVTGAVAWVTWKALLHLV
jgi:hypothetical protein